MARYLALDWNAEKVRVVEATISGAKLTVRRALTLPLSLPTKVDAATATGQQLKELLRQAGVAAAPVLASVGRDKVLFRDIRYPDVPASEMPAIIRFQSVKELNFPAEECAIDYSLTSIPWSTGEKRALAAILRPSILAVIKKICLTAGLKLESVSARPYGVAAGWHAPADGKGTTHPDAQAVFVVANGYGELAIVKNGELLFSRAIAAVTDRAVDSDADAFLPELRRSLAAYDFQFPQHHVSALHISGGNLKSGNEVLAAGLRLPVFAFDPLLGAELPELAAADRGAFTGAVGLLLAKSTRRVLPVNFLHPKEPKPPTNSKRRMGVLIGAGAALLVLLVSGWYVVASSLKADRIAELQTESAQLKKEIEAFADTEKRMEAINNWIGPEVVMLDELYDLVARFPDQPGMRVLEVKWTGPSQANLPGTVRSAATPAKPGATAAAKPVGQIVLVAASESSELLDSLRHALESNRHWKVDWEKDTPSAGQARATIKIFHQDAKDYQTILGRTQNVNSTTTREDGRRTNRTFPFGTPRSDARSEDVPSGASGGSTTADSRPGGNDRARGPGGPPGGNADRFRGPGGPPGGNAGFRGTGGPPGGNTDRPRGPGGPGGPPGRDRDDNRRREGGNDGRRNGPPIRIPGGEGGDQ